MSISWLLNIFMWIGFITAVIIGVLVALLVILLVCKAILWVISKIK